jgi:ElaB/YqjD/DUF883 family membrane-anchored ribosome-binding protein
VVSVFIMKNSQPTTSEATDAFLSDLRALVTEAEKLLDEAPESATAGIGSSLRARLEAAQERFTDLYAGARKQVIAGGKYTDKAIRQNPYQSLAIAACVGLLVGVLIGRRST